MKIAPGSGTDEVQKLTLAFQKMTNDLRRQMQELRETTTVRERMEGELSAARSIQMSLLPKIFPAFPERPEIDIHAIIRPAREIGGDLYDYFFLDAHRLAVVIGDVAGKGVPAALVMAVTKSLVKAITMAGHDAGEIIARVNHELCEEVEAGMFVTGPRRRKGISRPPALPAARAGEPRRTRAPHCSGRARVCRR